MLREKQRNMKYSRNAMPISEQMPTPVRISRNVNSTPIHSDARAKASGPFRPAMKFASLYGKFWKKLLI